MMGMTEGLFTVLVVWSFSYKLLRGKAECLFAVLVVWSVSYALVKNLSMSRESNHSAFMGK